MHRMRAIIAAGDIGDVVHVRAEFGFLSDRTTTRLHLPEEAGGALLDLGVYATAFVFDAAGDAKPTKVQATGHLGPEGTDDQVSAIFSYEDKHTASVTCSLNAPLSCVGVITGSKGSITVGPSFHSPETMTVQLGSPINGKLGASQTYFEPHPAVTDADKGLYNFNNSQVGGSSVRCCQS
jgi:predicted dehydrogenase